MEDNQSKKRTRELGEIQEKPLKLLKQSHNDDDDDVDDDDDDEINLEESDAEEPSLTIANDLTSQLMAINSTLLLNKNLLLSNMAQSLIMQSTLLVIDMFHKQSITHRSLCNLLT